jgi:ribonuclease E
MFGWVKKLFGGSPAEAPKSEPSQPETRGPREFTHDGPYRRRRRRGGQGRNFHGDQRGPREGQSGGQPSGDQRGYRGDQRHHGHRHHHHGGGGFHSNGRPEGGPPPAGS